MPTAGPKPTRNDSDPPPSSVSDYPGLERLDRPELDDDAPEVPPRDRRQEREEWKDESAVRRLAQPRCSA
jgi:hypothetical protein